MTSTYGNNYHYAEHVESGQFAFQTAEAGDYMACFWADDHKPQTTITVEFDWKSGVAAKDWTNVAKKGSVDVSLYLSLYLCLSNRKHRLLKPQKLVSRKLAFMIMHTVTFHCT